VKRGSDDGADGDGGADSDWPGLQACVFWPPDHLNELSKDEPRFYLRFKPSP
jgi:hypothetical protein